MPIPTKNLLTLEMRLLSAMRLSVPRMENPAIGMRIAGPNLKILLIYPMSKCYIKPYPKSRSEDPR